MKKILETIKNKWLTSMALTILLIAIIVCAYLAANYGIDLANITDLDFTAEKLYSISQETQDKLENLEQDVTIYVYNMETEEIEYYLGEVVDFIRKYSNVNKNIKIEKLEGIKDKTEWQSDYGVTESTSFIVVSTEKKEKILTLYDLYTYDYTSNEGVNVTEEAITNAILDITAQNKAKIYFLKGHNFYSDEFFQYIQTELLNEANEVESVDLLKTTKVPDDCNVLVISTLKEDITGVEKDAILSYIKNGGEILLLSDPNFGKIKFKNFQKVLDEYGIKISEGFILEADENQMLAGQPDFVISNVKSGSSIINGIGMEMNICLIAPAKITLASSEQLEKKNVVSEIFATVSDKAFYRTDLTSNSPTKTKSDEEASGATVGAVLTKKIDDNTSSKLVVFANTRFATNDGIYMTPQNYMYYLDFYNNKDVILNSIAYLTEREDTITIRKNVEAVNYTVTAEQNRIVLGIIFAIPAFIIIVGITVWIMRRRKK